MVKGGICGQVKSSLFYRMILPQISFIYKGVLGALTKVINRLIIIVDRNLRNCTAGINRSIGAKNTATKYRLGDPNKKLNRDSSLSSLIV